ncbi:MAG: YncE family protein [Blastocatellia bacterium]|nr:YncE family protein [Blastocatellia bacterium]
MPSSLFLACLKKTLAFFISTVLFWSGCLLGFPAPVRAQAQPFQVRNIQIGPGGSTPYGMALNPNTHLLYTANTMSDNLSVVDTETSRVVRTIPVGRFPVDVTVNPNTNMVYSLNEGTNSISVIDGNRNQVVETVSLGEATFRTVFSNLEVNPKNNRIYAAEPRTRQILVLDGATNTIRSTISLPANGGLKDFALNSETNQVYVIYDNSAKLTVIDGTTNTVTANLDLPNQVTEIGIHQGLNRIYLRLANTGEILILDGTTNAKVGTIPMPDTYGIGLNETTNLLYTYNFQGQQVSVIDLKSNQVSGNIPIAAGFGRFLIDQGRNRLYLSQDTTNQLLVVDTVSKMVRPSVILGNGPVGVAFNPTTNHVLVTNANRSVVTVLDGTTGALVKTIELTGRLAEIGVNFTTNRIYVANQGEKTLIVLDGSNETVLTTIPLPFEPQSVVVNPLSNRVYLGGLGFTAVDGATNTVKGTSGLLIFEIACDPTTDRIFFMDTSGRKIIVMEGKTQTFLPSVPVNLLARSLAFETGNRRLIVGNLGSTMASVFNAETLAPENPFRIQVTASRIVNNPVAQQLFLAESLNNRIEIIDSKTLQSIALLQVGKGPRAVAFNSTGDRAYTANYDSDTVSFITKAVPDTEPPMISNVTLSKKKVQRKTDPTVTISWNSSDNQTLAGHDLQFATDGQTFSVPVVSGLAGTAQSYTWTVPASVAKTKNGVAKVIARDGGGNRSEANSGPLTIK